MRLIFSPAAIKAFRRAPADVSHDLVTKLRKVADDPQGTHPWAKRLTDQPGFRVRQGDWRAIYRLDYETAEMVVDRIAKRDEVYR